MHSPRPRVSPRRGPAASQKSGHGPVPRSPSSGQHQPSVERQVPRRSRPAPGRPLVCGSAGCGSHVPSLFNRALETRTPHLSGAPQRPRSSPGRRHPLLCSRVRPGSRTHLSGHHRHHLDGDENGNPPTRHTQLTRGRPRSPHLMTDAGRGSPSAVGEPFGTGGGRCRWAGCWSPRAAGR